MKVDQGYTNLAHIRIYIQPVKAQSLPGVEVEVETQKQRTPWWREAQHPGCCTTPLSALQPQPAPNKAHNHHTSHITNLIELEKIQLILIGLIYKYS